MTKILDSDSRNHEAQCWRECDKLCHTLESTGDHKIATQMIRAAVRSALSTTHARLTARIGAKGSAGGVGRGTL